jgi:hypothetical protein
VTDFERAIKNPADVFDRPSEVLDREGLTREQKLKILHQWEYDALQREVATEENMPSSDGSGPALAEIRRALEALGETGESHSGSTKFG